MKKNNQPNKDEVKKQDNKKDDKKGAIPEVVAVSLPSLEEMEKQKKVSSPKTDFQRVFGSDDDSDWTDEDETSWDADNTEDLK